MPDFHKFMMRHGESSLQHIIEQVERSQGIRPDLGKALEDRWNIVMREPVSYSSLAA